MGYKYRFLEILKWKLEMECLSFNKLKGSLSKAFRVFQRCYMRPENWTPKPEQINRVVRDTAYRLLLSVPWTALKKFTSEVIKQIVKKYRKLIIKWRILIIYGGHLTCGSKYTLLQPILMSPVPAVYKNGWLLARYEIYLIWRGIDVYGRGCGNDVDANIRWRSRFRKQKKCFKIFQ